MKDYKKTCEDCACLIQKNGIWCCDEMWGQPCESLDECPEGIEVEQIDEITEKTKNVKIDHGATGAKQVDRKPRTVKISDEKQALFSEIYTNLEDVYKNVQILKENKLLSVQINGITFKIDIIQERKPKK